MLKHHFYVVSILCLAAALAPLTGCSGKKKIVAQPKQTVKAPEQKPAPAPQVQAPQKVEQKAKEADEVPRDLRMATIYFDFDKSEIRSDQRSSIINNGQLLSRYKKVKILVEGHCDERGTNEYNLALGQRRADAVKAFLVDYGIDSSRISTMSYGEERPVDTGHNETAWAKNRRSESVITSTNVSSTDF